MCLFQWKKNNNNNNNIIVKTWPFHRHTLHAVITVFVKKKIIAINLQIDLHANRSTELVLLFWCCMYPFQKKRGLLATSSIHQVEINDLAHFYYELNTRCIVSNNCFQHFYHSTNYIQLCCRRKKMIFFVFWSFTEEFAEIRK